MDGARAADSAFLSPAVIDETYRQRVTELDKLARSRGQSLAQLALQWVLRQPAVTSALVGASSTWQLDHNLEALSFPRDAAPPALADVQANLLAALERIETRTGRVPLLYTNVSVGNQYLDDPRFARFPLWIADWTGSPEPTLPRVWQDAGFRFWQRSSHYTLPAAGSEPLDFDLFRGARADIYR